MTIYIVMFFLIIAFAFIFYNTKISLQLKNLCFLLSSSVLLVIISGFRGYYVGDDTKNYVDWFYFIKNHSFNNLFSDKSKDIEYGYRLFSFILSKISNNPRIVIFFSSAIIIFSLLYFLYKHSDNLFISVVVFLGLNHFFTSLNTYRMYLALAIVIWAYDALLKKKYIRALIVCFAGLLFHRISIVFVAALFVAYLLRKKRRNVLLAFVMELVVAPFIPKLISIFVGFFPKYKLYLSNVDSDKPIGTLNFLLFALEVSIIVFWLLKRDGGLFQEDSKLNMLLIILSFCTFLRMSGNSIPKAFRMVQLLSFVDLLIIPHFISKDRINQRIFTVLTTLVSFSLYIYYLFIDAAHIVPYYCSILLNK